MARKCEQEKCVLRGTGQCPICSECGINPDIVSDNCVRCWNCEHDEGILRGDIPKGNEIEITITNPTQKEVERIEKIMQKVMNK